MPDLDKHYSNRLHSVRGLSSDSPSDPTNLRAALREELDINRQELERLYMAAGDVIGDLRYPLLGRLAELGRMCTALEWRSHKLDTEAPDADELAEVRSQFAELTLRCVELRQEAQLLLNAWQPHPVQSHAERKPRRLSMRNRISSRSSSRAVRPNSSYSLP